MSTGNKRFAERVRCRADRAPECASRRKACSPGAAARMHLACEIARRLRAAIVVLGLSAHA